MVVFSLRSLVVGWSAVVVVGCTAPVVDSPSFVRSPGSSESDAPHEKDGEAPTEIPSTDGARLDPPDSPEPAPEAPPIPEGSYGADTMLLAMADVNVRSGEGTNFEILTMIPAGTRVKVQSTSGASGWVNVVYDGKVGFSIKSLLSLGKYSASRGQKMADRARALWDGKSSRNLCLAGVDDTAESAGALPSGVSWIPRQPSAVAWQSYVAANPQELLTRGYVRENLDVTNLPKGAIIGWRGGQCGYDSQYGHIEIVVDDASSRACSDYCGAVKKTCGAPLVFIPIE